MGQVAPGAWQLSVTAPRQDGEKRARRVPPDSAGLARGAGGTEALAAFVVEVRSGAGVAARDEYSLTIDDAVERFLTEHLRDEKGREGKTIDDYRSVERKWFSPEIGHLRVRDVDSATIDRLFGKLRRAGLSRSRMNHARSLYAPFFRWARKRGMTLHNPMADFQLPTSKHVVRNRTPPEVEELCLLLGEAAKLIPGVAPVLVLGAVTGMRRGELAGVRRSCIDHREIGRRLGRSEQWATFAVAAAQRREQARSRGI